VPHEVKRSARASSKLVFLRSSGEKIRHLVGNLNPSLRARRLSTKSFHR
jgi:hypothetical protein